MREWLRGLASSLSDWYDEAKEIGGNFVGWCGDAPVVVIVLVGSTALLFGWLLLVGYFSDLIRRFSTPESVIRGTGVFLQLSGFILAAYGLERTLEKFERKPSTSEILSWLKDLRSLLNTPPVWEDRGDVVYRKNVSDDASADGNGSKSPVQSSAERIQELEQKVEKMEVQLEAVDDEVERLEDEIEEKFEAAQKKVDELRKKVEEAIAGEVTFRLEWWGISFFVYGVPLASFPSSFLPAYRVLIVPIVAGTLLGSLHWYAD